jgi:hypothetical protein
MSAEDFTAVFLFLGCAISIWLIVLFVGVSRRVTAIKRMLMVAFDLEEFEDGGSYGYRKRQPKSSSIYSDVQERG